MTDKPLGMHPIGTPNYDPAEQRKVAVSVCARQAYEDGMPLHVVRRRFHLSDSEVQDVAPEEFENVPERNKVSGY